MNVALVTENFNSSGGGAERSTLELCREMNRQGMKVTVVAGRAHIRPDSHYDFPIHSLSIWGATRAGRWRRFECLAASYLKTHDFDIVHSTAPLSCADVYQPRGGSLLYSQTRHADSFSRPWKRSFKKWTAGWNRGRAVRIASERTCCTKFDGPVVAALSDYVRRQFVSLYNLNEDRVRVVPGGIAIEALQTESVRRDGQLLRSRFDPNDELALFVFAAVNFRLKGLDWLLRSAAQAVRQLPEGSRDFRLLIIGPDDYTAYWHLSRKLNLSGRVLFLGSTEQMPAVLSMADAVVLPSYNDACSRLILEGLALGRPGITTSFNGASDFLDGGKYGIRIDACDDVAALAQAIMAVCDRQTCSTMCQAIQADQIDRHVAMARHVRQLAELYDQLVRKKASY